MDFYKIGLVFVLAVLVNCTSGTASDDTDDTEESTFSLDIQVKEDTELPGFFVTDNTVTAYFTITNNTASAQENVFLSSIPENATQVTSDGTYANTCPALATLAVAEECTLQLTISGEIASSESLVACVEDESECAEADGITVQELSDIAITPTSSSIQIGERLRLTATGTLTDNSTEIVTSDVSWYSSDEDTATVSSSGVARGVALGSSNITLTLGSFTSEAVTVEVVPTLAYIASLTGNSVTLCTLDASTHELADCDDSGAGTIFNTPVGMHFSADEAFLYIVNNANDTVTMCAVDATDGTLSDCATTGSGFDIPSTIDFNSDGTRAYVGNLGVASVSVCDVDTEAGTFSNCTLTGSGFLTAYDVNLNADDTYAYISDLNLSAVTVCAVNSTTGLFENCADSGAGAIFSNTTSMTLNAASDLAYNNADGSVVVCDVDATTGLYSNCADSGITPIVGLQQMIFNVDGTVLYMTKSFFTFYDVISCDVNVSTGVLNDCTADAGDDAATLVTPTGMVLKQL